MGIAWVSLRHRYGIAKTDLLFLQNQAGALSFACETILFLFPSFSFPFSVIFLSFPFFCPFPFVSFYRFSFPFLSFLFSFLFLSLSFAFLFPFPFCFLLLFLSCFFFCSCPVPFLFLFISLSCSFPFLSTLSPSLSPMRALDEINTHEIELLTIEFNMGYRYLERSHR